MRKSLWKVHVDQFHPVVHGAVAEDHVQRLGNVGSVIAAVTLVGHGVGGEADIHQVMLRVDGRHGLHAPDDVLTDPGIAHHVERNFYALLDGDGQCKGVDGVRGGANAVAHLDAVFGVHERSVQPVDDGVGLAVEHQHDDFASAHDGHETERFHGRGVALAKALEVGGNGRVEFCQVLDARPAGE